MAVVTLLAALATAAAAPALTNHQARAALKHYYRGLSFRIYSCEQESPTRVRCDDGLLLNISTGGTSWCNGRDTVQLVAGRPRVELGGCSTTISERGDAR